MNTGTIPAATFRIWGADNVIYGPVELPVLVAWVKDERVTPDTWVFAEHDNTWRKAVDCSELQMFFKGKSPPPSPVPSLGPPPDTAMFARRPGTLRRIKLLADFTDGQLETFVKLMNVHRVAPGTQIVKQGETGDAMYLVIEGEVRVRMFISGKSETTLVTLGPGEFFGEMSLFDEGPRSADVVANKESVLLKISSESFARLVKEAPQFAAPFLLAMGKSLAARIRADNKRYRDSVVFARAAK